MNWHIVSGGGVASAAGFLAGAAQAAIKKAGRYDLALIVSEVPAAVAGVFTTNKFQAAPVVISRRHLQRGTARGIVVNSGCANACTGEEGLQNAVFMAKEAAAALGCSPEEIVVSSTGVIGVQLPMERIKKGIKEASSNLSSQSGSLAAQAIMTTDTFPKEYAVRLNLDGKTVTVGGMAKGSGMIHPNMATMLGFLTTDAAISPSCLQDVLNEANRDSFNMITVDGDTSTNDMLVILANGAAGNDLITDRNSSSCRELSQAVQTVCGELAKMVAQDGEGATKLMTVEVVHAANKEDARKGARSIAGSNLVKAALYGEDANWGRIICALGYSGADFNPDLVDVYLGDLQVAKTGCGLNFDEEKAAQILRQKAVTIRVDLNMGEAAATAWGL